MTRAAIINAFDPETYKGGIETFILSLKALLTERNIRVDTHSISPAPTLPVKPFPFKSLSKVVPEFLLNCFMSGRAFSEIEKDYDLVISNNFYGLGYYSPKVKSFNVYHSTHAGYADALRGKLPERDYRILKYLYGHLGDRLSGRGKAKIAVSSGVKDELERYYGFKNVSVVNHGIDTDFYKKIEDVKSLRRKWDISDNAFAGLFAGRWETGKGIDILEDVIKSRPDTIWLLAVGSSECHLSNLPNVRVIKDADKEAMRELYSLSDFMLFPSYYEGFGLVIAEAMACSLPVICTEVGVAKDLLRYPALKKLILPMQSNPEMVNKINDRISFLREKPDERTEITSRGRSIIERDYSMALWKDNMAAVLGLNPNYAKSS